MLVKVTLDNGIRLVVKQMPYLRSATIGVYFGVGSRDEEFGKNNGISHFIEHMMFKGTEKYTCKELAEKVESLGAYINAFTGNEKTAYYIKTPSDDLKAAADILYEMLYHSTFDQELIDQECNVVLEEIARSQDDPSGLAYDAMTEIAFNGHPLGWEILGTEEVLVNLKQKDMKEYIADNYTTDNTIIAIAGNVTVKQIQEVIDLFSTVKPSIRNNKQRLVPILSHGTKIVKKDVEQANIYYGYPAFSIKDEKKYTLGLLNNILGGGMSSRLFQEVREKKGLAYSVASGSIEYSDSGLLYIYAGTTVEKYDLALKTIQDTVNDLLMNGITDFELDSAKAQFKGLYTIGLEDTKSNMTFLASNELIFKNTPDLDERIKKVMAITKEDVMEVATQIFTKDYALGVVMNTPE